VVRTAGSGPSIGRTLGGTVVGALGLAFCLTLVYLSMRNVMAIGGSCASGGPYVIAQPCPKGSGWMMTGGIFGLFVFAPLLALSSGRGPQLWTLTWSALFLSLGWNFIDFALDPPEQVTTGGWMFCGILFWLMGGLPLLAILVWAPRATFWGAPGPDDGGGAPPETPGPISGTKVAATVRALGPLVGRSSVTLRADPATPPWVTTPPDAPAVAPGVVDALERLAELHRRGDLTDAEFEAAKRARLEGS
jgi:hypothetical protein